LFCCSQAGQHESGSITWPEGGTAERYISPSSSQSLFSLITLSSSVYSQYLSHQTAFQAHCNIPSSIYDDMDLSVPNVGMTDSVSSDVTSDSSLAVFESVGSQIDTPMLTPADSLPFDSLPEVPFTCSPPELTAHVPGDTPTPHNHNHNPTTPAPQVPQFDPRSLLNPRSSTAKRPASSGGEADHGRTDPTIAGQVSLVERLHNVQGRTVTPVKRVKTENPRKLKGNRPNIGGGSALDFQSQSGQSSAPQPQSGPAIDLTMSEILAA